MDAFELLKADHAKVAELFDLLETASGKRKLDVFKRIKSELELHTHIEEAIFYPALEKPEKTHDLTLEAYEEHKVVKTLLTELSGAKKATDEWQAQAKVLRENVEHHVDEEENELFDKSNDALSDEEIESLGERMAAEKARKQGRPAPKKDTTKSAAKEGIISKIADFVGLGSSSAKTAAKKAPAKKKAATAKRSTKAGKSSRASAKKRSSAKQTSKQASGSKSSGRSKKQSRAGTGSQSTNKRPGRQRK
jgi:hemerythrin-like domain-containing protein